MQSEITQLHEELQRQFPASEPKLKLFPSGAARLDVKIGSEVYVLEYHLDVGVGISRRSTATFGWEGYEKPFDTFDEAKTFLLRLLNKSA